MKRDCVLVAVALVMMMMVVTVLADDCSPPAPGEKPALPWDCCKYRNFLKEDAFETSIKKCTAKYPLPKHEGPPTPPTAEMKSIIACAAECVFEDNKLLTADKKVDKAAITKLLGSSKLDKEAADLMAKSAETCFASHTADIDQSLECKSGAKEIELCLLKESVINCPKSMWTDTSECKALKARVTKCPSVMSMMMNPHGH